MYYICMYSRIMQTRVVYSRVVFSSVMSSTMQFRHLHRSFHVAKPGGEMVANKAELPGKWVKEGQIKAVNLGLLEADI